MLCCAVQQCAVACCALLPCTVLPPAVITISCRWSVALNCHQSGTAGMRCIAMYGTALYGTAWPTPHCTAAHCSRLLSAAWHNLGTATTLQSALPLRALWHLTPAPAVLHCTASCSAAAAACDAHCGTLCLLYCTALYCLLLVTATAGGRALCHLTPAVLHCTVLPPACDSRSL